jgi:sugar phosphate isomerase/epimerase
MKLATIATISRDLGKGPAGQFFQNVSRDRLAEELAWIRSLGFEGVQIGFAYSPDEAECLEVRRAVKQAGLSSAALSGYYDFTDPDPARREANLKEMYNIIEAASLIGARAVATWGGFAHPGVPDPWPSLVQTFKDITARCEDGGVTLAIELYDQRLVSSFDKAAQIITEVRSKNLGVVADPPNTMKRADLARMNDYLDEMFAKVGRQIVLAHAKDVVFTGDDLVKDRKFPCAGAGQQDYAGYLSRLIKAGYDSWLVIEHVNAQTVGKAKRHVEQTLAKAQGR